MGKLQQPAGLVNQRRFRKRDTAQAITVRTDIDCIGTSLFRKL
jgi:hypothetical protein